MIDKYQAKDLKYYIKVKSKPIPGNYKRIFKRVNEFHKTLVKNPRKKTYIRVHFFNNEKVFLNIFWKHLQEKGRYDRRRRLQYYICAIELLRTKNINPDRYKIITKEGIFYKFIGITKNQNRFAVQIKVTGKNKRKLLMSVFPLK